MLGSPWDKIVVLAIVISAISSTQTTIIPASRTTFSMARAEAFPARRSRAIHPRFRTPAFSTVVVAGARDRLVRPGRTSLSENFLFDTLSALSLMIAFYYALTGIACAVYYRRELREVGEELRSSSASRRSSGAAILGYLFVKSVIDLSDPENSYTGESWLGVGPPLVIASGSSCSGRSCSWPGGWRDTSASSGRRPFETVDPAEVAS